MKDHPLLFLFTGILMGLLLQRGCCKLEPPPEPQVIHQTVYRDTGSTVIQYDTVYQKIRSTFTIRDTITKTMIQAFADCPVDSIHITDTITREIHLPPPPVPAPQRLQLSAGMIAGNGSITPALQIKSGRLQVIGGYDLINKNAVAGLFYTLRIKK